MQKAAPARPRLPALWRYGSALLFVASASVLAFLLQQLIVNLVMNSRGAIKATPAQSGELYIRSQRDKSIVDSHGGRLRAMPSPSRGATFQFTLLAEVRNRE